MQLQAHVLELWARGHCLLTVPTGRYTTNVATKYWVVTSENTEAAQKFDRERFNIRKLNQLEVRKKYQIKIANSFADLENLNDDEDMNSVWEKIKENIKTSAK